jgi:hypothetical protein
VACRKLLHPPGLAIRSAFQLVVRQMDGLPRGRQDECLRDLLRDTVGGCREALGGSVPGRRTGAATG